MYKLLLCLRYLRTRYIALASIVSVMLGVATMIVVNSVMSGFTNEMQTRLHGILGDISIEAVSTNGFPDAEGHMEKIKEVLGDDVEAMTPICTTAGIINYKTFGRWRTQEVIVIGIDANSRGDVGDFHNYLQHPENRKHLSFDLREGGYDTSDHQADRKESGMLGKLAKWWKKEPKDGEEKPLGSRMQMEDAGWEHRKDRYSAIYSESEDYGYQRSAPSQPDVSDGTSNMFNVTPPPAEDRLEQHVKEDALEITPEAASEPAPEAVPATAPEATPETTQATTPDATTASSEPVSEPPQTTTPEATPGTPETTTATPETTSATPEAATGAPSEQAPSEQAAPEQTPLEQTASNLQPSDAAPAETPILKSASTPGAAGTDDPFGAPVVQVFDPLKEQHAGAIVGIGLSMIRSGGEDCFLMLPGDDFKLTFPTNSTPPVGITDNFTCVDLYESKMSEYDSRFIFIPIEKMQELRGMADPTDKRMNRVNQIQLKMKPGVNLDDACEKLRKVFDPYVYDVMTWRDRQIALLQAVEVEISILNVLLFMIIAVSGFGILAIFFMVVIDKTRDIGILKALGASSWGVMSIFLMYGLSLGVVGSGVGMVVGLLFVWNINEFADFLSWMLGHPVFNPDIYYFYQIPYDIDPWTVTWIVGGAMLIAVLASVFPAWRAARLQPVESLRYE